MTHQQLEEVIDKSLPFNNGIMLTGGQRFNNPLKLESDIDVIVLDVSFTNVYGFVVPWNEYMVDVTIVPFLNLENILFNEANDPKGGLLTMLNMGVIVKDKYNVLPLLQIKAGTLLDEIGGKTFELYQSQMHELGRYIKHFSKPFSSKQKAVLACDVMTAIGNIESIKASNWVSKKHKLELFSDKAPNAVCEEAFALFEKSLQDNDYTKLAEFTNYYCRAADGLPSFPVTSTTRVIIDLNYVDFSIPHVVNILLPAIKKVKLLEDAFGYFFLSPKQLHKTYKNKICLSFRIESHTHAAELIQTLDEVLIATLSSGFRFAIVYQTNNQLNENSFRLLEELRVDINKIIIESVLSQRYTPGSQIQRCILLSSYVAACFKLSNTDISKANSFLIQHSLFSIEEQHQLIDFSHLKKIQETKLMQGFSFYQKYRIVILENSNNGLLISQGNKLEKEDDHQAVISSLDQIIKQFEFTDPAEINLSYIALKQSQPESTDILLYVTIIKELLQFFNLAESDKIACLVSISRALSELKVSEKMQPA
jgi:hypothetical protein